jgi:oligoribonuclease (3'-5' exoribonuclease)
MTLASPKLLEITGVVVIEDRRIEVTGVITDQSIAVLQAFP